MALIKVQIMKYLQIVSKSSFLTVLLTFNHMALHHQPKNYFLIQGLKFFHVGTFCKMLVKNNLEKKHFLRNLMTNLSKKFKNHL